jgi:CHASE3 domain sensor protein
MSLKLKITLGFAAICLIFLAIGAALGLILANIRSGAGSLSLEVMPNSGHAS